MYIYIYIYIYTHTYIAGTMCPFASHDIAAHFPDTTDCTLSYGVATISRLLKIIGLFCRISSLF